MTNYVITPADRGVAIELTGAGEVRDELLAAFGECAAGRCSCPTEEYAKLETMAVEPGDDKITIELRGRPGTTFDTDQIGRCLDYAVEQASAGGQPKRLR